MTPTKDEVIQYYKNLSSSIGAEASRQEFVKNSPYSRRAVDKLFGSFSGLKAAASDSLLADLDDSKWEGIIDIKEKGYVYNADTKRYIVFLKKFGKNAVLRKDQVDAIRRSFSDTLGDASTISEIARAQQIPRPYLIEILRTFGITHDSLPLSDEEIEEKDPDEIASDLLEMKKFKVVQEFNKKDWHKTSISAKKWEEFQSQKFNPFVEFINSWTPPAYDPVPFKGKSGGKKTMIVGFNDVHVGLVSNGRYNFFKGDWDHSELQKSVKEYGAKLRLKAEDSKTGFKEAYLAILGDVMHGIYGYTDKGTKLEAGPMGEEQYDLAYSLMVYFINELLTIFPKVHVKSLAGNHSSFGDYVVATTLQAYYRNEPRITFEITTKRYLTFKIGDCLFAAEHGYSPWYKARLPRAGVQRENYINGIFLSKPELSVGVKGRYFLSADQHHFEVKENNFYEHIMFATIVKADRHSDNCGYNNRARQNCLVVDEDGVQEIISIYLD